MPVHPTWEAEANCVQVRKEIGSIYTYKPIVYVIASSGVGGSGSALSSNDKRGLAHAFKGLDDSAPVPLLASVSASNKSQDVEVQGADLDR